MRLLRDAARALRATPLVTAVAILSLALGIGANTAMFSIVDALVLRALPVRHAERLALLADEDREHPWTNPIWESIRARADRFDGALAYGAARFDLSARGEVDRVAGLWVSGSAFRVLGVDVQLGRPIVDEDDRRGAPAVAVISDAFWRRRFGGARDVIGRTIALDRVPVTIVGVAPASFLGPEVGRTFDVAIPLGAEPTLRGKESRLDRRSDWWLTIMLRLRPGQSLEQARTILHTIQPRIAEETRPPNWRPQDLASYLADPLRLRSAATGSSALRFEYRKPLYTLAAIVGLTLLIACGNIANLLLARATARRHELSLRTALGASSWRIARQLLVESLLLAGIGAALGALVATWGSRIVLDLLSTSTSQVALDVGLHWRTLAFTSAVAVTTALLFGTVPALRAARVAPIDAMKEQGRGTSSHAGVASSLVVAQVALSFLLLVGAGLFVRTFASLAARDLGFERDRALVVSVDARRTGLDSTARAALYDRLVGDALAVPGVSRAALSTNTPVTGDTRNQFVELPPDRPAISERDRLAMVNVVSPGWFQTLGMHVVAGRDLDRSDRLGAPRALVVNRAFVKKFFDGVNPLGQIIREPIRPWNQPAPLVIVGVVNDAAYETARETPPPTMYYAFAQERAGSGVTLTVRASGGSPAALSRSIGAAVMSVNPDLAITFRPLADIVDASLTQERLVATLSAFFGALALLLAALGLYGVTSYAVHRRNVELGIRMAIGTTPAGVIRLVLGRTAALVGVGLAIGAAASWGASSFVTSLLYGLAPGDPATLVGALVTLAAVGAAAGLVPALRASRIDPARVLREG